MDVVLVIFRYLFLVLLYLFLFQVIRASIRDLHGAAKTPDYTEAGAPGQPYVVLMTGGATGEAPAFPLKDSVSLGRDASNDIVLPGPTVSGHHAVIIRRGNEFWLQDAGSTNGTFLNGKPVAGSARLRTSDKLTLGETTLQFMG